MEVINENNYPVLHWLFISHTKNDMRLKKPKLYKNNKDYLEKVDQDSKESVTHAIKGTAKEMINI